MDLVSYVRISMVGGREGDSFQSPEQRRQAIAAIAARTAPRSDDALCTISGQHVVP